MGNVNAAGIWTPDEGDNLNPEVWSSAMADSIQNGIGDRLTRQEQAIGLKAGIAQDTRVKFQDNVIAPYAILGNGTSNFNQGMKFDGGVATVEVAGMYLITAAAALSYWGPGPDSTPENQNRSIALQIKHNGGDLVDCEVESSQVNWQTAQANAVVLCAVGDALWVNWYSAGPGGNPDPTTGAKTANNVALQSLSIVLITPVAA